MSASKHIVLDSPTPNTNDRVMTYTWASFKEFCFLIQKYWFGFYSYNIKQIEELNRYYLLSIHPEIFKYLMWIIVVYLL